jgi:predicted negative regulator of RcsB-dependent stress response
MARLRLLLIPLVLTLAACSGPQPAIAPAPGDAAGAGQAGIIVTVQGDASVKRAGWQNYAPALFGAPLQKGDLLRIADAARVVVACADLKLSELPAGVSGFPCRAEANPDTLVYKGRLAAATRGDANDDAFPTVLSPRQTRLLNPRPTLRWSAVPGAASYQVSLQGADWSTTVNGATELAYPSAAPALQPGVAYRLVVAAGDRSSNEETGPGLGFALLDAGEAAAVQAAEAKIQALGLPDAGTRLLIANLYAVHGLYAEAITLLAPLAEAGQPAVARLLGDLYLGIGLNREAEASYLQALSLSEGAGDVEGQAAAHAALGTIYAALGSRAEAEKQWRAALAAYDQLGDQAKIAQLRAFLNQK